MHVTAAKNRKTHATKLATKAQLVLVLEWFAIEYQKNQNQSNYSDQSQQMQTIQLLARNQSYLEANTYSQH